MRCKRQRGSSLVDGRSVDLTKYVLNSIFKVIVKGFVLFDSVVQNGAYRSHETLKGVPTHTQHTSIRLGNAICLSVLFGHQGNFSKESTALNCLD